MIKTKEFWEKLFEITKEENIKIIKANLAGPADILEAQLQPILWHYFRNEGIVSVVEISYDKERFRRKLDMVFDYLNEHYVVEIKRNGLELKDFGKTYTDSIDRYPEDFQKLNTAQINLEQTYNVIKKIFIEIQYFEKTTNKYEPHREKLKKLIALQSFDWRNGTFFEFGGPDDIIYKSSKGSICIAMRILLAF